MPDSKKRSRLLVTQLHEGFLDEEEFCALYDVNSTDYPVFEHGKYRRLDLNRLFKVTRRMASRGLKTR